MSMPFRSEKQRRYLHAKHPVIAHRWEKEAKRKMSDEVEWLTEADIVGKTDWSDVSFCDCCSPLELSLAVIKAKKKSKPFHGYNKKKHARTGGLSAKGRAHFKRTTGANLKRPVTKKPSKLKRGGKAAKRRKSFCARMSGVKGPTSKKGKLTPKGAALKRWNC
jgi:hypothetical protein